MTQLTNCPAAGNFGAAFLSAKAPSGTSACWFAESRSLLARGIVRQGGVMARTRLKVRRLKRRSPKSVQSSRDQALFAAFKAESLEDWD